MIESNINSEWDTLDVFIADTFFNRLLGYMFRKKPHYDAIMITPCNSVHTFFMRFDIDVIFVDKDMVVIKKLQNIKPGRIIEPVIGASAVIETISGRFEYVCVGQKIDFIEKNCDTLQENLH